MQKRLSHLRSKWASTRGNLSSEFANNKDADQPAHPRRLLSAFIVRSLERIISKLATSENSIFLLIFVAEQVGLGMTWSETQKTCFLASRPIWYLQYLSLNFKFTQNGSR